MLDPYNEFQTYREARAVAPRNWYSLAKFLMKSVVPAGRMLFEFGADLAKEAGRILPETWNKFIFRRFWGQGLTSADAYFVIDSYEDVRLRSGFRRLGPYQSNEPAQQFAGSEIIHGTFAPQAAAMLTALFLRHADRPLRIVTDTELGHKVDSTLICYGTADSNFKTFDIEASSEKHLCQFSFNGGGQRAFRLGGQLYSIEERAGSTYDKAILMRVTSRGNAHHSHVICAGLTEWGSLAAVHYLTREWKALYKRFGGVGRRRDFCILLDVECGQFESTREVASAVWWEPQSPHQFDRPVYG